MAIEIVSFPMNKCVFHSYVKLLEDIYIYIYIYIKWMYPCKCENHRLHVQIASLARRPVNRLVIPTVSNLSDPSKRFKHHGGWTHVCKSFNVGIAIINHPFLMVYITHLWWLGDGSVYYCYSNIGYFTGRTATWTRSLAIGLPTGNVTMDNHWGSWPFFPKHLRCRGALCHIFGQPQRWPRQRPAIPPRTPWEISWNIKPCLKLLSWCLWNT